MADPITRDLNTTIEYSEDRIAGNELKIPNSAQLHLFPAPKAKTSDSPYDFPFATLRKKSRKLKPMRCDYTGSYVEIERSPPIINFVTSNPASSSLSLQREKSPTKVLKTEVPKSPAMFQALEVTSNPSSSSLSLQREKSPAKVLKIQVPKSPAMFQALEVTSNPSSSSLSLQREKSPTKVLKTQVPKSPAMFQALEVTSNPSSSYLSLQREKSPSKVLKTQVPKSPAMFQALEVTSNPSSSSLSLQREKSPTKVLKTQVSKSPAMIQALELWSSLGSEFPCCIKIMVKSQVSSGYWMGLPSEFCIAFLPTVDATFVLEDEEGKCLKVKYIANKSGLSAGWKNFALGHNLTVGDVLLFHLIKTTKFKVYIFKANDAREVDGARVLLDLDAHTKELTSGNDVGTVTLSPETQNNKHPESLSLAVVQKKRKRSATSSRPVPPSRPSGHFIEQPGNPSEEVGAEVQEVYKPFKPKLSFREVKTFTDFHIVVKGLCVDHELPEDVRFGYYKLCLYRKEFLHHGLREDMYDKLVVGIIGEIVSIANKIKNCKFTTTKKEFEDWDKSLKFFELMGMKVDFLLDKMNTLARLLFESEGATDMKKYLQAKIKQEHIEEEIKTVAAKLKKLKEAAKKANGNSGFLKQKAEKFEYRLKKDVDAPW